MREGVGSMQAAGWAMAGPYPLLSSQIRVFWPYGITSGRCARCCSAACRRGHRLRGCEYAVV